MASQRSSTTEHDFQDLPPAKIRSAVNKAVRYGDIASLRSLLTMAPKETDQVINHNLSPLNDKNSLI